VDDQRLATGHAECEIRVIGIDAVYLLSCLVELRLLHRHGDRICGSVGDHDLLWALRAGGKGGSGSGQAQDDQSECEPETIGEDFLVHWNFSF
jgi:hypothetical protein